MPGVPNTSVVIQTNNGSYALKGNIPPRDFPVTVILKGYKRGLVPGANGIRYFDVVSYKSQMVTLKGSLMYPMPMPGVPGTSVVIQTNNESYALRGNIPPRDIVNPVVLKGHICEAVPGANGIRYFEVVTYKTQTITITGTLMYPMPMPGVPNTSVVIQTSNGSYALKGNIPPRSNSFEATLTGYVDGEVPGAGGICYFEVISYK
jgi:hypothetical protein